MSNQHADATGAGRTAGRGSVEGDGTHACPPGFPVKGNASSKLAHLPGGRWYDATIPEICFATPEDAEDAGYRVTGNASERTWVRGDGSHACPDGFPIKGNLSSMLAHPPESRYFDATIPEVCFATAEAAVAHGYRISGATIGHSREQPTAVEDSEAEAKVAPQPPASSSSATGGQNPETTADSSLDSDEHAAYSTAAPTEPLNGGDNADQTQIAVPVDRAELPQPQTVTPAPGSDRPAHISAAPMPTEATDVHPRSATDPSPEQAGSKRRSIRHDGSLDCPTDFPIKGIERTRTAVGPSDSGYNATIPDICFETMAGAIEDGYRSVSSFAASKAPPAARETEPQPSATIVVRIRRWWVKRK
jgi:hypothetical protein